MTKGLYGGIHETCVSKIRNANNTVFRLSLGLSLGRRSCFHGLHYRNETKANDAGASSLARTIGIFGYVVNVVIL